MVLLALARKQPIPGIVENAPEVFEGLQVFLEAFEHLTGERPTAYGYVAPIPRSRIREWIAEQDGDAEFGERCLFHVGRLDATFREWSAEQKPAAPEKPGRKIIGGDDDGGQHG